MRFASTVLASLWLVYSSAAAVEEDDMMLSRTLAHRLLQDTPGLIAAMPSKKPISIQTDNDHPLLRRLPEDPHKACDAALAECMQNVDCLSCFAELKKSEGECQK